MKLNITKNDWWFWVLDFIPHKRKSNLHDYKNFLINHIVKYRPKRILEFGPGRSTQIMAHLCPTPEIITIEHKKNGFLNGN